jgi:hypothetical protein
MLMRLSIFSLCVVALPAGSQLVPRGFNHEENCAVDVGYNVGLVASQARALASHSWEYGTAAEAFLELYNHGLSVFGADPFPGGEVPKVDWADVDALAYVKPFILLSNQTLIDGDGK